jgi:hypothetical protein
MWVTVSIGVGMNVGGCGCRCGMSVGERGYGVGKIEEWAGVLTTMTIYRLSLHPQSYAHPHTVIPSFIRIHTLSPSPTQTSTYTDTHFQLILTAKTKYIL